MKNKYCLNLEDMSKSMFECLKSFYKTVEQKGGEKVSIDENESLPKCVCKVTSKMCVASIIKQSYLKSFPETQEVTNTESTELVEYDDSTARKCPYYSELED